MFMCLQSQLNSSCPSYRVFRTHPKKSLIVIRSRCQQSQPNVTYGASSQKKLSSLEQKRYGLVSKQRTPKSTQKQIFHVWTIPSHNVSQFFLLELSHENYPYQIYSNITSPYFGYIYSYIYNHIYYIYVYYIFYLDQLTSWFPAQTSTSDSTSESRIHGAREIRIAAATEGSREGPQEFVQQRQGWDQGGRSQPGETM